MRHNKEGSFKLPFFLSHINPSKETNELLKLLQKEYNFIFREREGIKALRKFLRFEDKLIYKKYQYEYKKLGVRLKRSYYELRYLDNLLVSFKKQYKKTVKRSQVFDEGLDYAGIKYFKRIVTLTFVEIEEYIPNRFENFIRGFIDREIGRDKYSPSKYQMVFGIRLLDLSKKVINGIHRTTVSRMEDLESPDVDDAYKNVGKYGILKYLKQGDGNIYISVGYVRQKEKLIENIITCIRNFLSQYFLKAGNIGFKKIIFVERKI
jgi:hypothetical protein